MVVQFLPLFYKCAVQSDMLDSRYCQSNRYLCCEIIAHISRCKSEPRCYFCIIRDCNGDNVTLIFFYHTVNLQFLFTRETGIVLVIQCISRDNSCFFLALLSCGYLFPENSNRTSAPTQTLIHVYTHTHIHIQLHVIRFTIVEFGFAK